MNSTKKNTHKASARQFLIASLLFLAVIASVPVHAADYFVLGRIYSASPLTVDEEPPDHHPLTGVPEDQILGQNLLAQAPRNLVKVKVISAATGTELDSYITQNEGGYLISFTAGGASISARIVVEELATSTVLFDSMPVTLNAWPTPNIKYILIEEDLAGISGDREFATNKTPPEHTAIFTRVGKIEVQTEDPDNPGTQVRIIDYTTGEATVIPAIEKDLAIPGYKEAAFGGNLYLFGALSQDLYSKPDVCYTVKITDQATATSWDFTDPLVKTKYTVDFTSGTVNTERVTLGPKTVPAGGVPNCYKPTPLSAGNEFWSFPDLLALWRSGARDGLYKIEINVHNLTAPDNFVKIPKFTDIKLRVDNNPPVAQILPLDSAAPDTPRVYTPGDLPPVIDLMPGSMGPPLIPPVGKYPDQYGGSSDPTCAILNIQGGEFLAFKLTAYQPNGYLDSWHFSFERNDKKNQKLLGKIYDGSAVMADQSGVAISSSETATSGFQERFLYLDSAHLDQAGGPALGDCAYRFVIRAARRVTDGYHWLSSRWDQDLHYIQK